MTKYDYVIVGGGTAGCVLAARLSEHSDVSVCVVEAGPDFRGVDRPPQFKTGGNTPVVDPEYFWAYQTSYHRSHEIPSFTIRGRVTGGSSAINGAEWVRGIAEDYDSWGSELWSFSSVLPSFKRAETDYDFTTDVHGDSGPIPVRRHPRETWSSLHNALYDAGLAMGYPERPDINDSPGWGVSPTPMNLDSDGLRFDAALAYLDPARDRPNLVIHGDTVAMKILWDGTTATGVEVEHSGERFPIEAGEVILSSGALASPHVLLVSGVGPAEELRELGIEVVADVPGVGRNLQDHPSITMNLRLKDSVDVSQITPASPVIIAFTAEGSTSRNDMLITIPWYRGNGLASELLGLACRLNAPAARGYMRLDSGDINDPPTFEYCYLEDERDLARMRDVVRRAMELTRQPQLSQLLEDVDGPSDEELRDDARLDDWLTSRIGSVAHSAGTCKMGPEDDPQAVVDDHCRVRGVENLRVADLSIAPYVPRANLCSTAIMIGERLAAVIDEERLTADVALAQRS